jgi:rod shape-determining protein MreC
LRNGLRSIAYGRGQSGALDLRFMAANADIQKGDLLVTSGIDGVYPAGLAVATVAQVETKSSDAFAHIVCTPVAGVDRHKQLLILLVDTSLPPRPPPEVPPGKNEKSGKAAPEARDKAGEPVAKGGEKAAEKSADTTAPKPDVKPDAKPAAKPAASATPSSPPKVAR